MGNNKSQTYFIYYEKNENVLYHAKTEDFIRIIGFIEGCTCFRIYNGNTNLTNKEVDIIYNKLIENNK
jgi:hypothetical protein